MKWTKQQLNNLFFIVGVVAVVVMILTFDVSFNELWHHLAHAGYWLIPILGIWLLVYGLNALAWKSIIKSCSVPGIGDDEQVGKVSPWRIYRLTITGYALNYATPVGGLGGEPYRIMELSKNIGNQRATSSVILYAMMHFFAHFWLWFTSIFLYLALAVIDYVPMTPFIGGLMGAAIVFCLVAFYVFSKGYKHGLVVKLIRWIGKIPGLKGWSTRFQERHAEALQNIDKQIAALHKQDKRSFYYSLFMEYASRIVQSLEILFMLLLFGIDCGGGFEGLFFTFLYSVLILSFTTLLANLIGFLPMQLGVQEGGFMLSIALIGMSTKLGSDVDSAALGIFVSIICRVREILWIAIGMLLMKIDELHLGRKAVTVMLAIVTMTGFSSCCGDDDEPLPWTLGKAERTVMVYMAAENNLSSLGYLKSDLLELIEGSRQLTDKQRLLVFIDSLGNNKQMGFPRIVELHGGKSYTVKQYGEEFYSSDPAQFREILQTMTHAAEADSYGLVLWGHASGWLVDKDSVVEEASPARRSYGQDWGSDGNLGGEKYMNISQMARALEALPHLDYIFADCCNMQCIEVAYELRHATDYLIGSPAEIPGSGAPYHKMVPRLFQNDTTFYKGIIDTYYDYYKEYYAGDAYLSGYSLPLSVVDTRQLDSLLSATRDILPLFVPSYPQSLGLMQSHIAFYLYMNTPLMYDMRAMMRYYTTGDVLSKWDDAFNKAVPYRRMSKKWYSMPSGQKEAFGSFIMDDDAYGCVSMFVPLNTQYYSNGTYRMNHTYKNYAWHQKLYWDRFGWVED
ncbi:clostripain-related cysteine peptidase [Prevotella communis]|uniref:clostripain-related cysteine peptidase n=1 Tax=Prevotella communis TaxID=2913614 RepID=UPI001EDB37BF|nr:clostripain-related cysteine peptidase [Prevotella communis]UKK66895.1 clostripain-related cysteine peptidase [Prevotella communis]UKK70966.1 clostripain-related cysteine peptidase [Prevotella communis]